MSKVNYLTLTLYFQIHISIYQFNNYGHLHFERTCTFVKGCQIFEPQASADLAVAPPRPNLLQQTVDGAGVFQQLSGLGQIQLIKQNRATGQTKDERHSN